MLNNGVEFMYQKDMAKSGNNRGWLALFNDIKENGTVEYDELLTLIRRDLKLKPSSSRMIKSGSCGAPMPTTLTMSRARSSAA